MLNSSAGYQALLKWGASPFLKGFGWQLEERLGIARKEEVKQEKKEVNKDIIIKKVRDLGETKANR
ncbi:MAG: hypothetical protein GDA38_04930 [Hormoscilla sp. SP12CHS1]|nr:hypothetical protein [Hormoscilla sp. SP12CHS1]